MQIRKIEEEQFEKRDGTRDGTMKAIFKDSHFLVPFFVLVIGILLLYFLR